MEADTASHRALAIRTNERCPSCSAPMVGTSPNGRRAARQAARISSTVWIIFILQAPLKGYLFKACLRSSTVSSTCRVSLGR